MKVIGITGGIGAGKTTVCKEFQRLGAKIIDADEISRRVTAKNGSAYGEIVDRFGEDILLENGEINRKKLAGIVFSNKEKLDILNKITHKHIFSEMKKQINTASEEIVILDVPLLFSSDFPIFCDIKIAVLADIRKRIDRVIARDGLTEEEVKARINNQYAEDEYRKFADICIVNEDEKSMKEQVEKIFESVRG